MNNEELIAEIKEEEARELAEETRRAAFDIEVEAHRDVNEYELLKAFIDEQNLETEFQEFCEEDYKRSTE